MRFLKRWALATTYAASLFDLAGLVKKLPVENAFLAADENGVGQAVIDLIRSAGLPVSLNPVQITAGHETTYVDGSWHVPKKKLVGTLQVLLQGRRLKIAAVP
jgi:hypothetical protein